jgi:hypothetical protein
MRCYPHCLLILVDNVLTTSTPVAKTTLTCHRETVKDTWAQHEHVHSSHTFHASKSYKDQTQQLRRAIAYL